MRLLNVDTFQLEEFLESDVPRYGALSHTWGKEEVSFTDLERQTGHDSKAGWIKIQGCAQLAKSHGLQYIWVDTCCIDKSSSAELSEAINSMFRWYAMSSICFVYLADLAGPLNIFGLHATLGSYRWFTSGWTL
ncbi:hypothetical protein NKR23_g998 [Pleurostoma richardsiae]|uniref:Heterokaryon incompatibility domain-containing protein n=1 Tax=Pleurostoma richardsiae TaxID=41990 RepID=A0AA38VPZ3_9PEZI|nr:hypothetical protein NKR23_g998 [Pleurostoma richardsiae]